MSKLKDRVVHFVDDWTTHADAFTRTGFWGAFGGAGGILLARNTGRLLLARRSRHVLQPGTWGTVGLGCWFCHAQSFSTLLPTQSPV